MHHVARQMQHVASRHGELVAVLAFLGANPPMRAARDHYRDLLAFMGMGRNMAALIQMNLRNQNLVPPHLLPREAGHRAILRHFGPTIQLGIHASIYRFPGGHYSHLLSRSNYYMKRVLITVIAILAKLSAFADPKDKTPPTLKFAVPDEKNNAPAATKHH